MTRIHLLPSLGLACLLLGLGGAQSLPGATFTGSFTSDDQLFQTAWTTQTPTTFTAYTTSYASGGFVPVISLFNQATGDYLSFNGGDASCSAGRMKDAGTGLCDDAYLSRLLPAGSYWVVLSQFYNLPNGNYSDGFSQTGTGNFTAAACNATGSFWQVDANPCVQRTGNYALTLNAATPVPEPATGYLLLGALAGTVTLYRKKRRH